MDLSKPAVENNYPTNKDVKFKKLDSLYIKEFRTLKKRTIILGDNITLISGKNGTMKSSILGLIAHPFSSPNSAKDIFGHDLKTIMSHVFKMSLIKDTGKYQYYINATTSTGVKISEPVRMYISPSDNRHRITVGKTNQKGLGNFLLNTAYINLKRLFPIIDTDAHIMPTSEFTDKERQWISRAYLKIMTRDAFTDFDCISDYKEKNTLGPRNASYDFNSISSGEDNLGNILMKMLAFVRFKTDENILQGIFCIDEIEASLHPVALTNLFDFLLEWSKGNNIQVVATTHSLYLIEYALRYQNIHDSHKKEVCLNIISTALVGSDNNYNILNNPSYKYAYKELTLKDPTDTSIYKINILCEDELAALLIKKIIKTRTTLSNIEFISNVSGNIGTSCQSLLTLGKNGPKLLEDSILVLDPDVTINQIEPVRRKNVAITILPNVNGSGLAIEKDVLQFIMNLDGNNPVFKDTEKTAILNSFHQYNIYEGEITPNCPITTFKNWYNNNKRLFSTFLTVYVKENISSFGDFKKELLKNVNTKRGNRGLPPLPHL